MGAIISASWDLSLARREAQMAGCNQGADTESLGCLTGIVLSFAAAAEEPHRLLTLAPVTNRLELLGSFIRAERDVEAFLWTKCKARRARELGGAA
jgi:hypothetical protein